MKKLKFRKGSLVRLKSLHTVMNDPTLRIEIEGSMLFIDIYDSCLPYLGSATKIRYEMDKKFIKIKDIKTINFSNNRSYKRIVSASNCLINEYLIEEVIKY